MSATQNQIDKQYTVEELAQLDSLITSLEKLTADLPCLAAEEKNRLVKPPDNAGDWMQNMVTRSLQNLELLPRKFDPADVERDLLLDSTLEIRELRIGRIADRLACARFMARSDAFGVLLGVRRQLKEMGVTGVDDNLSEGLQSYFARGDRKPAPEPAVPKPAVTH